MNFIIHFCTICGREKTKPDWFLLAENRWGDKLKILEWDDGLARAKGVQAVCSPKHARELVVHWMRTSGLHYPEPTQRHGRTINPDPDVSEARQLGELYLHRESIAKILDENPNSVTVILDQLVLALHVRPEIDEDMEGSEDSERNLQLVGD